MNAATIFAEALRKVGPDRARYLDEVCQDQLELRAEVDQLLQAHANAGEFLVLDATEAASAVTEQPGDMIGPYKLLQQIGEGGFGVVYMAEQKKPIRRKVALKIIKLGMDTRQVIARFEAERQALAMMDHPNIARVLDAGSTETGRPYFVMELVRGDPITEYCDSQRVGTTERLRLFIDVCHAVQHAHHKGIIHRDIKPSNVMVTMHDGLAVPKVIDFGIAKATQHELTEKTLFTEYRQFLGTPAYMSPEQAEMSGLGVDTRSDIYSLGVLLYELLTGTPPFEADQFRRAAFDEIVKIIREKEPPKPSLRLHTLSSSSLSGRRTDASGDAPENAKASGGTSSIQDIARMRHTDPDSLTDTVRGDLDWIVMKALEKDRGRRYETAKEMAEDIGRHLNNEPVSASPPSATYRLRKYIRRNRPLVVAGSVVTASLLIGLVVSVVCFLQAARQRDRAVDAERRAVAARDEASRQRDSAEEERDRALQAEALAARRGQQAEQQREEAVAIIDLLGEMIGSASPEDLKGPNYTVRQLLDEFSTKLDTRLTDQPEVDATVRLMVSDVYHQFHLHDRGLRHAEAAYQLRRQLYGDEHELTIRALRAKGLHMIFLQSRTEIDDGRAILRQILELSPPFMAEDHEFTLRTKNGDLIFDRSALGVDRFRELLEEAELKLGEDHHVTSRIRNNYSGRLSDVGNLKEAELQIRKAITAQESLGGHDDPLASAYRTTLSGILSKRADYQGAQDILRQELPFQREHLGHVHRLTFGTLRKLLENLYWKGEPQAADEVYADFVRGLNGEETRPSLFSLRWLMAAARRPAAFGRTPATEKLLELAAILYLDWLRDASVDSIPEGQTLGTEIARSLAIADHYEQADQVLDSIWDACGNELAAPDLVTNLVHVRLASSSLDSVAHFLRHELSPESDSFHQLDTNGDGKLTSTELPGFWSGVNAEKIDLDDDQRITTDDTGETLWYLVADADRNNDGAIVRVEYEPWSRLTILFGRAAGVARALGGFGRAGAGFVANALSPSEEFADNDKNGDDRLTINETDEEFWKSIVEFDTNADDAVDRFEFDEGQQRRELEKANRFFTAMDRNADGRASRPEVPPSLWERWRRFDADGDDTLSKEEFLKAQNGGQEDFVE